MNQIHLTGTEPREKSIAYGAFQITLAVILYCSCTAKHAVNETAALATNETIPSPKYLKQSDLHSEISGKKNDATTSDAMTNSDSSSTPVSNTRSSYVESCDGNADTGFEQSDGPPDAAVSDKEPTDSDPLPQMPKVRSYAGYQTNMNGNASIGPSAVMRHPTRDVVAVYYLDTFETEPYQPGTLYVLDGRTESIHFLSVWDFVFSADGRRLYYSSNVPVVSDEDLAAADTQKTRNQLLNTKINEVAKKIGTSPGHVREAMFTSGHSGDISVCRMYILYLNSGRIQPLPLVGGGMLKMDNYRIIGFPKPYYYESNDWEEHPVKAVQFSPEQSKWLPLADAKDAHPSELFDSFTTSIEMYNTDETVGTVMVQTRNKKLGLVVVGPHYTVDAATF